MLLFKLEKRCCSPDGLEGGGSQTDPGLSLDTALNDAGAEESQQQNQDEPAGDSGGNENQLPAWVSQLPKEMRTSGDWGKFEKLSDLANAYQELASKANEPLQALAKDAKPEEIQAFYEKIGKPKGIDGYTFTSENADAEDLKKFKEMALAANLTNDQAKAVYESFDQGVKDQVKTMQAEAVRIQKETDAKLHEEFGQHYPEKLTLIQRGMRNFITPDLQNKIAKAGLKFDNDFIHLLLKLGEATSEAGTINKGPGGSGYKTNAQGGRFHFKDID